MTHEEPAERVPLPDAVREAVAKFRHSPYSRVLQGMLPTFKGKTVAATEAGTSGFVLRFADETWVAAYLVKDILAARTGAGATLPEIAARLHSARYGDASAPLSVNLPYANQSCDIAAEVAKSIGQPITGLAIGSDCFNFCFPGGMELDTMLVSGDDGRLALRVYWEQW